jgi:hypothetical protein
MYLSMHKPAVMLLQVTNAPPSPAQETWPATWRHSSAGKAGLTLLGLAFLIATCIQLQGVLTKQWHKDYRYVACNTEACALHYTTLHHSLQQLLHAHVDTCNMRRDLQQVNETVQPQHGSSAVPSTQPLAQCSASVQPSN